MSLLIFTADPGHLPIDRFNLRSGRRRRQQNGTERVYIVVKAYGMSVKETVDVQKVCEVLSIAFANSIENDYLTKKYDDSPITQYYTREEINRSFEEYCHYFMGKGGMLLESNDFDCVAIVVPPEHNPLELEATNDPQFNEQFIATCDRFKHELGLGNKLDYYYLFMIGKNLNQPHIKGSARAIVDYLKRRADEQNVAVVLEAINESAKGIYQHFGFVDYGAFHYGVGEVNSKGEPDSNGKGLKANFMAYYKDGELPLTD